MNKIVKKEEILDHINDGDMILVGGFLNCGGPVQMITYILDNKDLKDVTIVANDTGFDDKPGVSEFVTRGVASKVIASHVGTNRETGRKMHSGEMEVELVPQGTLVERIRAGGYGLGGVLTPTGLGLPEVEKGKEVVELNGQKWLYEKPIIGDVALIKANVADKYGNLAFHGSTRNYNIASCFSGRTVIVQADKIVETGEIGPERVEIPGALVDYIVATEDFE